MSTWNTVAVSDVLTEFNDAEKTLLNEVQGATTELQSILTRTIKAARGCVQAGGGRVSDTDTEIADQLAPEVVAIARWRWLLALPGTEGMQTPARQKMYEDSMARMDKVASGAVKVQNPITPDESSVVPPSFDTKTLNFDACSEEGL